MTLAPATRIGPYEIIAALGAGGMGEVYRARDAKLNRDVALKVLPADFAGDADRLARFKREAQVLASLNHPNIAAIFGFEDSSDVHALVMELVEGPTLADRIAHGALPFDEALPIATQIAEALEAAHEQGIIHRDLKPANIKVRPDGTVKVLDFGLAKAMDPAASSMANASMSPTLSMHATQAGVILGTAAYMSPEQAAGKAVDRRSDLWAFGVVLLEMLTGRRVFDGETVSHVLASVLKDAPDWTALPAITPAPIRRLLRRCLEKDRKRRLESAADARLEIDDALTAAATDITAAAGTPRRRGRLGWAVAGVAVVGLLTALVPAVRHMLEPAPGMAVHRFTIEPPPMGNVNLVAVSPDGRRIAFIATGPNNNAMLWVRPMDALVAQVLPGTEGAGNGPFWSPDSRFLLFSAAGKIKKIDLAGGAPQIVCDAPGLFPNGATWNDGGVIVFSSNSLLYQVPASGGQPSKLLDLDMSKQETAHAYPFFLPDNRRFLFTAWSSDPSKRAIYVASIDTGARVRVGDAASMAVYSPAGFLLYQSSGTLMAQPFDAERAVVTGEAVPIAEKVSYNSTNGRSSFSVARNGTLVYTGGTLAGANRQIAWRDRSGTLLGTVGNPDSYRQVRLSPDERRIVYQRLNPVGDYDLWLLDLASGIASRFTSDPGNEGDPVWAADGRQVAFTSTRGGKQDLYIKTVGASQDDLLFASSDIKYLEDWSKDGQTLIFRVGNAGGSSLHALALTGERKATKVFESPFTKDEVHLSPDGHWVAFNSDESGRTEVYVASFPGFADKRQVSNAGGGEPFWRKDGRELFYLSTDGKLMSVDIKAGATLESGTPEVLFQTRSVVNLTIDQYSPAADGQRFLVVEPVEGADDRPTPITVVLDWAAGLKQ